VVEAITDKTGIEEPMIGILIVTHRQLGDALIDCVEFILGNRPDALSAISIDLRENAADLRTKIEKGIKAIRTEKGALILTDMFGGTPSNLSYSFLEDGRVEVISGVNLPMLLKAVSDRKKKSLAELAEHLEGFGKKSISLASGILKGNKRS
jgi:mannose PTS system EIIA component